MKELLPKEATTQTGPRVLVYILHIKETKADFQRKTGIDRSLMTRAFRKEREFGLGSLERIGKAYPDLSLDWVITGEGEMLKSLHPSKNEKMILGIYRSLSEMSDKARFLIEANHFQKDRHERELLKFNSDNLLSNLSESKKQSCKEQLLGVLMYMQSNRKAFWVKDVRTKITIKKIKGEEIDSIPYPSEMLDQLKETKTLENLDKSINSLVAMQSKEAIELVSTYRGE